MFFKDCFDSRVNIHLLSHIMCGYQCEKAVNIKMIPVK